MIYLDNAGTTKMFEKCIEVHKLYSCENYFNPSAVNSYSVAVSKQIVDAERYFLSRLGAKEGNILFTGCATESNNLAIRGSLRNGKYEYVFSAGEHPSVFNLAKKLQLEGFLVHIVPLLSDGTVDLKALESVLNDKTRLVSVMHVNNETGAVNDLEKISALKNKLCPKAFLHVDGVQGFMKIPVSLAKTNIDLYSFSGHKFHAPKGVAGLYVKNKSALKNLFEGGGQQYSLRSGTENVSGIMQMKCACENIDVEKNLENTMRLQTLFNQTLLAESKNVGINSLLFDIKTGQCFDAVGACQKDDWKNIENSILIRNYGGSPYIENLVFVGVKGETMLHVLDQNGVIVGLGSACSAKKAGNRVLENIGLSKDLVISSIRVSFNAYMTDSEIVEAAKIVCKTYKNLLERMN